MNLDRLSTESVDDYAVRLYENKSIEGLDHSQIADLLNKETGLDKDSSSWRKHYTSFMAGIEYERNKIESGVKTRILSVSDLHYPFSVPVDTFRKYSGRIDTLVLNGDIVDHQGISKFPKKFRLSPMQDLIGVRNYLIDLIELLKPSSVYFTYGNHELRFGDYVSKNVDSDISELMPDTVLDYLIYDGFTHYDKKTHSKVNYDPLTKIFKDIEFVFEGNWWCQIGDVIFCHPKAFVSSPMKTAEKAVVWFRNNGNIFNSLVMAHTHRVGTYKIGKTMTYEQGACCEVEDLNYSDGMLINSQKKGFIYVCLDKDGKNMEDKTRIICLN